MAKVIITITDDKPAGAIKVKCEFDPPAKKDVPLTVAQDAAFRALAALKGSEEDDDDN